MLITTTTTLKARAWVPDRPPSAVVAATYTLQPATPTLTSHFAEQSGYVPFRHYSLRVAPSEQTYFITNFSYLFFEPPDVFGNRVFTLGAGPVGADTSVSWTERSLRV